MHMHKEQMKIVKSIALVFLAAFSLFLPVMAAQQRPRPLCVSQIALVNYACASLQLSALTPNLPFPDDDDHDHVYPLADGNFYGQDGGKQGYGQKHEQVPNQLNQHGRNYTQGHIHSRRQEHEHEGGRNHRHGYEGGYNIRHGHERGHNRRHGQEGGHNHSHGQEGRHNHRHGQEGGHNHRHGQEGGHNHRHGQKEGHNHRNRQEGGHNHRHGQEEGHIHSHGHDHRHEHQRGSRHKHSHHRHHRSSTDNCCKWLNELDDDCVCQLLRNLSPFLSRLEHTYSLYIDDSCSVTYSCDGWESGP